LLLFLFLAWVDGVDGRCREGCRLSSALVLRRFSRSLAGSFAPHNLLQIRDNAELAVRNLLKEVAKRHGKTELYAIDHLDDGTPIELNVSIDEKEGSAVFGFAGTGPEIFGNLNAPVSVTYSAIIYCLRAMVDQDVSSASGTPRSPAYPSHWVTDPP
jgi:hypothetical protein